MSKRIDLTGQTFGHLTVVKASPIRTKYRQVRWECICDCGKTSIVTGGNLRTGAVKSCGCLQYEGIRNYYREHRFIDLTGKSFGELTPIKHIQKPDSIYWVCFCSCGKTTLVKGSNLKSGNTKSCGCTRAGKDLTGMVFGKLTALKAIGRDKRRKKKLWSCQCECGNKICTTSRALTSGSTKSCGCMRYPKGRDHYNWKEQLSPEHRKQRRLRYNSKFKARLSISVFQRDSYTCQHCGEQGCRLAAHHILPWATYPELRYATENCITLCKHCHNEFHSMYGWEDFDDEDLNEYLT